MKKDLVTRGVLIAFTLSIFALAANVIILNALPIKYLIIVIGILIVIEILICYLLLRRKKKTIKTIVTGLLTIMMVVASGVIMQAGDAIKDFTDAKFNTHIISAVVMNGSYFETINDLQRNAFGTNPSIDGSYLEQTIFEINKGFDKEIAVHNFETNVELVEALYNGNEVVILFSESQRGIIEDSYPTFSDDTRVIYQHGVEVEILADPQQRAIDVTKDTYTIFLSGIDTVGGVNTVSRSDVNMLVTVNPRTHQILLTSLPRDTHVKLATIGKMDKLTNAGAYGIDESVLTLENFFDLEIDYYFKVNFSSVEQIVDALGGVDINSQFEFTSGKYYFPKGVIHMDGEKTLRFVRERRNLEKGDDYRILNQQAAVKGILNKVMSPAIISNYSSFLNSIEGTFIISMEENDFKSIIRNQLDTMTSWDVIDNTIFGEGEYSYTTYSAPNIASFVDNSNPESVARARRFILEMNGNERITIND